MGKTYSVYIKDDELAKKIDRLVEEEFHSQAHFFSEAAEDKAEEHELDNSGEEFV